MDSNNRKKNPIASFFRLLVETRWVFTFSASATATIIGISLTFGINSCRERQRVRGELEKSMVQASENLLERLEETHEWVEIIQRENRLYELADSFLKADGDIPDSVVTDFVNSIPYIRLSAFDHDFEKIFRGSYQLWQQYNSNDDLRYYIASCFDGLNVVEETCQEMTDEMLTQIEEINKTDNLFLLPKKDRINLLLKSHHFRFFMAVRAVKMQIAANILEEVQSEYDTYVVPLVKEIQEN